MGNGYLQVIRDETERARAQGRAEVGEEILAMYGDTLQPEVAAGILAVANGERPQSEDTPQTTAPS